MGDEVRQVVGLCAQDAHIFDSTIRENLRLARPACDDDELRDALRRVRLLEWVERLPDGLGHPGRGGWSPTVRRRTPAAYLSPGRCWPTSPRSCSTNPPPISTNRPQTRSCATSLTATTDRATVLITHRLSALELVDEIIVLKNGGVAERGRHDQLVRAGGLYAHSWRSERDRVASRTRKSQGPVPVA